MVARNSDEFSQKDTVVVGLPQDLGSSSCQPLQVECNRLEDGLRRGTVRRIVIDCSATNSLGCAALGLLLRVWKTAQEHGGSFALCGLSSSSSEMLRVVKLDRLWPIYASTGEALDAAERGLASDSSLSVA